MRRNVAVLLQQFLLAPLQRLKLLAAPIDACKPLEALAQAMTSGMVRPYLRFRFCKQVETFLKFLQFLLVKLRLPPMLQNPSPVHDLFGDILQPIDEDLSLLLSICSKFTEHAHQGGN